MGQSVYVDLTYNLTRRTRKCFHRRGCPPFTYLLSYDFNGPTDLEHTDSGVNGFYMTEILGTPILVVTDEAVAEDLMVRRSKHNSDRPEIRSICDSKSTNGSMEYLPLMGKNGEGILPFHNYHS